LKTSDSIAFYVRNSELFSATYAIVLGSDGWTKSGELRVTSASSFHIHFFFLTLLAGLGAGCIPPSDSPVRLNEVMPSNSNNCRDSAGEHDDWIELYNTSDSAIDLGGYSLTNDTSLPRQSAIPSGLTIKAHGTLLLWADGTLAQGNTHLTFKLKSSKGEVVLYDADVRQADLFRWTDAATDISFARFPDGTGTWESCAKPTCGGANSSACGN
jgi:hypothetical protein